MSRPIPSDDEITRRVHAFFEADTGPRVRFVERGSREWARMWAGLGAKGYKLPEDGAHRPCPACCPETGECWQYMGTVLDLAGVEWHQFRHRNYPGRGRVYVNVCAGPTCATCDGYGLAPSHAPDGCPECGKGGGR